ncbi:MAG: site-specific integrase [Bdellovibrionaceae bacterium]|nr:site-specific integrase [Pseudobdellovibrionaceae bacterium]
MKIEKLKGKRSKPYRVRVNFKAYYFATKNAALKFKLEAKASPDSFEPVRRERKSLLQFANEYLERKSIDLKYASRLKYSESLRLYISPQLGHCDLGDIRRLRVEEFKMWLFRKEISLSSKNFHFNFFKSLLKDAFQLELIAKNPALGVRGFPKPEPVQKSWSEQELMQFLSFHESNPRLVLYLLAANVPCRLGELFGLKRSDIDFENMIIHIQRSYDQKAKELSTTKTKTKRVVHLPDEVAKYLVQYLSLTESEFVIPRDLPGLLDPKHASRVLKVDCKKAGVRPIRFHDLRHTWATLFVAKTGNPLHAQRILGHKSLGMTARYAHTNLEQIKNHRNTLTVVPKTIVDREEQTPILNCHKIVTNSDR